MRASRVRVRFAPAPTDLLDVGGAVTALVNWLYARKTGGTLVLRIEDDAERSAIADTLEWLGLGWDEGPYLQSTRSVLFHTKAQRLLSAGHAYHCFCTPEELDELRRDAERAGTRPGYDGRCRRLPADEVAARLSHGVPHMVRFRVPPGRTVLRDLVRGERSVDHDTLDDFVIIDAGGRPAREFAAAVDDAAMDISHVIRGDEDIDGTPRQVLVCRALGYRPPRFAHLPAIRAAAAGTIDDYRSFGYCADGIVNYLALLGGVAGSAGEAATRAELIEAFSLERVTAEAVEFDEAALRRVHAGHFRRLDPIKRLTLVCNRLVEASVLPADFRAEEWRTSGGGNGIAGLNGGSDPRFAAYKDELPRIGFIMNVMGDRLDGAGDVADRLRFFFKDDYPRDASAYAAHLADPGVAALLARLADVIANVEPFARGGLEAALHGVAEAAGVGDDDLIRPCRVALTGEDDSPDIFAVIQLIGSAKCVERLRAAAAHAAAAA